MLLFRARSAFGMLAALMAIETATVTPQTARPVEQTKLLRDHAWFVTVPELRADLERRIAAISGHASPAGGLFDKPTVPKPLSPDEVRDLAGWYLMTNLSRRLSPRRRHADTRSDAESTRVVLLAPIAATWRVGAALVLRGRLRATEPTVSRNLTLAFTGWSSHLVRGGTAKQQLGLLQAAARRAAALAAHTLRAGAIDPLIAPGVRLALWPVAAPTEADMLVFSKAGRKLRPAAVTGLPHDVTSWFTPDTAPLAPTVVIRLGPAARYFAATSSLDSAHPALQAVLQIARRMGVNYVLMARTTDIELDDATSRRILRRTGKVVTVREARSEAIGALLRVSDGAIIWRDTGTAEMTANSSDSGSWSSNKGVARDAMRFALKDLQRRFVQYRRDFER